MADKTAFLSVFSKDGIVDFASALVAQGFRIISSTGTFRHLKMAGVPVEDIAELTGFKPILGHKVVTLHPYLYAGLLAAPNERAELEELGFPWIDLVCCDFYPLEDAIAKEGATQASVLQDTDIGGPSMVRAGAKGRRIVICDVADRGRVLTWLGEGMPYPEGFLNRLAFKAEMVVAKYCLKSANYHSDGDVDGMIGQKVRDLKYGENPCHAARLYRTNENPIGLYAFDQVGGTDPSLVNYTDIDRLARTLMQTAATFGVNFGDAPCIAIAVKHGNACGAGVGMHPTVALKKMIEGNVNMIFGGVVMTNFPIERDEAEILRTYKMAEGKRLLDGVVTSSFSEDAGEVLERKNGKCRMFENAHLAVISKEERPRIQYRRVGGGFIRQDNYPFILDLADPEMDRGGKDLELQQRRDLALAFAIGSTSSSNTITLVKNGMVIANAVGQQSRVISAKLALMLTEDGGHDPKDAVAYSDSFFPFPDGAEVLAKAGVSVIFASSGSMKDAVVRETLNAYNITFWQLPDAKCRGFFHH